jgi:hypothetical protein
MRIAHTMSRKDLDYNCMRRKMCVHLEFEGFRCALVECVLSIVRGRCRQTGDYRMSASSLIASMWFCEQHNSIAVLFETGTTTNYALRLFASSLIVKRINEDIDACSVKALCFCGEPSSHLHSSFTSATHLHSHQQNIAQSASARPRCPQEILFAKLDLPLCGGATVAAAAPVNLE